MGKPTTVHDEAKAEKIKSNFIVFNEDFSYKKWQEKWSSTMLTSKSTNQA